MMRQRVQSSGVPAPHHLPAYAVSLYVYFAKLERKKWSVAREGQTGRRTTRRCPSSGALIQHAAKPSLAFPLSALAAMASLCGARESK
jgi:hypothetical protein